MVDEPDMFDKVGTGIKPTIKKLMVLLRDRDADPNVLPMAQITVSIILKTNLPANAHYMGMRQDGMEEYCTLRYYKWRMKRLMDMATAKNKNK